MPWWSLIYLAVFGLLSIAGIVEQFRTKQLIHAIATLLSAICFILFVVCYFNSEISNQIGLLIIPMLLFVTAYDWWLSDLDLQPGSETFFKTLPDVKSKLSDMGALIILLPGYLAGIMVAYRVIING